MEKIFFQDYKLINYKKMNNKITKYLKRLLNTGKIFAELNDNGELFKKPLKWIFVLMAILNLLVPFYVIFNLFKMTPEIGFVEFLTILLAAIILLFAGWAGFQLWWTRKNKVEKITKETDDFVAIPVVSYILRTVGEWVSLLVMIIGVGIGILTTLFNVKIPTLVDGSETGILMIISAPIIALVILITVRFISELSSVATATANNTKKIANRE